MRQERFQVTKSVSYAGPVPGRVSSELSRFGRFESFQAGQETIIVYTTRCASPRGSCQSFDFAQESLHMRQPRL